MRKSGRIMCLTLAPSIAFAHEGLDPGSVMHAIAHVGEFGGLLVAVPVVLAIAVISKRRRAVSKSASTE